MVPKLDNMSSKSITKADKFINKHTPRTGDQKPPAYRLTIDYSTLNKSLLSCPVHALPDIQEIKEFTRGKIINTMDLTNAYFSIKIESQDIHKTNFYFQDEILALSRLPQGTCNSPPYLSRATKSTFTTPMLASLLNKYNIKHKIQGLPSPTSSTRPIDSSLIDKLCQTQKVQSKALPLAQMVKSDVFKWDQSCAEAWSNIKFLMSLAIRNYALDPTLLLLISTDASKMFASFCAWQIGKSGLWNPIKVNTKIFRKSDINKGIVVKELIAILFEVSSLESIIRSSPQKVVLFSDSLPLSYLHRNKNYSSSFHDAAIFLSSFSNLKITFASGKIPAFLDILTRQFQEVYMNTDSPISL